jgi:hypothetical protein
MNRTKELPSLTSKSASRLPVANCEAICSDDTASDQLINWTAWALPRWAPALNFRFQSCAIYRTRRTCAHITYNLTFCLPELDSSSTSALLTSMLRCTEYMSPGEFLILRLFFSKRLYRSITIISRIRPPVRYRAVETK